MWKCNECGNTKLFVGNVDANVYAEYAEHSDSFDVEEKREVEFYENTFVPRSCGECQSNNIEEVEGTD